jgi:CRP-like cAMP-binding protein
MQEPDSVFKQLFKDGKSFLYNRGDTILRAGDTPSGVYLLVEGWVKVYSLCEDGESNIIMNFGPQDLLPLDWAVTGAMRDISFTALEPTRALRISRNHFLKASTDPAVTRATALKLADYFCNLSSELENLHYRSARERVAFRLVRLASYFGEKKNGHIVIRTHVPNEYIARSTNMTRETASREISRFTQKGLIQNANGYIIIKDLSALQHEISKSFDWPANSVNKQRGAVLPA